MIKPEELRIGNLLFDRDDQLCKVEGITGKEIDAPVINWPITGLPHKPIPLSEEWLLKCGFRKDIQGCWFKDGFIGFVAKFSTKENVFCYQINKFTPAKFKFVHQLQNLVHSLTGEELTIKN